MSDNTISPLLDNHPRKQLCFIIEKFGHSIINDSRRCRGLLKDLAPNHPRETNLLMLALEQKAVVELAAFNNSIPLSVQLERLAQRLHDNFGTQKEFAFWAVESWALALEDKKDDDAWLDELIAWADENDIPVEYWYRYSLYFNNEKIITAGFPRHKETVLNLTELHLFHDYDKYDIFNEYYDLSYQDMDSYEYDNFYLPSYLPDFNRITDIPESIGKLVKLNVLNLIGNSVKLPKSICNLTNLSELYLSDNKLDKLPDFIGGLTNLTLLALSENNLTELPKSIGNLTNLELLYLRDNKLTELPESISKLTNLTELYLNNNQLTKLSESIGKLTNLISLDLSENNLTDIPESIANLTDLEFLDLSGNPIKSLPPELSHLSNITRFDCPQVKIEKSQNNVMEGKESENYENGGKYIGEWNNEQRDGYGTYFYANGDKYVGEWKNNVMEGQGTYIYANGNKYIGQYKNNKRDGNGSYFFANGTVHRQIWKDGNCLS